MAKTEESGSCCPELPLGAAGFKVEAVLSVDERGQMVLPKDVRLRAGLEAGARLALISFEREGKICCLCLVPASDMADMAKALLGPMLNELNP